MIDCSMTRLLCMRLGTGPSGTTLEPAYCETGRPLSQANIWSSFIAMIHLAAAVVTSK
jgi:hypothetical protein